MTSFLRRIADNRSFGSLANQLRRRRFRVFERLVERFDRPVRVLDVGGTASYWKMMGVSATSGYQIVLLNRRAAAPPGPEEDHLRVEVGDARDLSRYGDGSFDVVFSNSVIEHLGDVASQHHMAREVMRVGRRFYVQTPNRSFPLEPHFMMPYFQFWPRSLRILAVRHFNLGWYNRTPDPGRASEIVDEIRLIGERELRALFPRARIYHERVLGISKSLVAYGEGLCP